MSRTYKDRTWETIMIEAASNNPRSYYIHNHHNIGLTVNYYPYASLDGVRFEPRAFCSVHADLRMGEYLHSLQVNEIKYVIGNSIFLSLYVTKKDVPCSVSCENVVLVSTYEKHVRYQYADYCTADENHVGWSAVKEDGLFAPCTIKPNGPLNRRHYGVYEHGNGYCPNAGKTENHERSHVRNVTKNIAKAYNTRGEIDEDEYDGITFIQHEYCYC